MSSSEKDLNRSERRFLKRHQKKHHPQPKPTGIVLTSIDSLLEDNIELEVCKQELVIYKQALEQSQVRIKLYRAYRNIGVSEESLRRVEISKLPIQTEYDPELTEFLIPRDANPSQYFTSRHVINSLTGKLIKYKNFFPDDMEVWLELLQDREVSLADLFSETARTRKESVDLISLQIEWLAEKVAKQAEIITDTTETKIQEKPSEIIDPFLLDKWNLYWSKRNWSDNPNHLVQIPTDTREIALKTLGEVSRDSVMIKPGSILRAVEFHLSKDVIQRALATRMKYGPQEIKDWIKLKRGRDRILLRVVNEETAIVFAGNRDTIYRRN